MRLGPPRNLLIAVAAAKVRAAESCEIGEQGNFPMAYGEMELVEPNKYFGVKKPVTLPAVPEEKEKANDLLTIDAVVDLPDSEKFREFPKAGKQ